MKNFPYLLIVPIFALISGCGVLNGSTPAAESRVHNVTALQLYLARASLFQTEFEQFKLVDGNLFFECGEVRNGRQKAKLQEIKALSPEAVKEISEASSVLADYLIDEDPKFADLGDLDSFADPGKLTLVMTVDGHKLEVNSSLDSVAGGISRSSVKTKKVAMALRSWGRKVNDNKPLCGNQSFFGL